MSTPQEVITAVAAKLATEFPTWTTTFASGYMDDITNVQSGETYSALSHQMQMQTQSSNVVYQTIAIDVIVHHCLSSHLGESTYTAGDMLSEQGTLLDPNWWRDIADVFDVLSAGTNAYQVDITRDVSRIGNVISWGITAVIAVTPE